MELILILLAIEVVFGILGSLCAHSSRRALGFWLGFLLGPLGILIAVLAERHRA